MFTGAKYHQQYMKTHIMKFRTTKELKNMILSINLAILTFLKLFVQVSETF